MYVRRVMTEDAKTDYQGCVADKNAGAEVGKGWEQ